MDAEESEGFRPHVAARSRNRDAQHSAYRLEYWNFDRAPGWPYFLRSLMRGSRVARRPAAAHIDRGVEGSKGVRQLERLRDDHAQRLPREVILEWATVDQDAAASRPEPHPRHRGLPPSGTVELRRCGH